MLFEGRGVRGDSRHHEVAAGLSLVAQRGAERSLAARPAALIAKREQHSGSKDFTSMLLKLQALFVGICSQRQTWGIYTLWRL